MTISADGGVINKRNRFQKTRGFSCSLLRLLSWPAKLSHERNLRPVFLEFCGTESEHRAFTANLRCGRIASLTERTGVEIMKSESYLFAPPQRIELEAGTAVRQVVYLPELFDLEVKAQSEEIWCCAMPPRELLATVTNAELKSARQALMLWNRRIEQERKQVKAENVVIQAERDAYYSEKSWERRQKMPFRTEIKEPSLLELDTAAIQYWALTARELSVRLDSRTRYPIPHDPEFRALFLHALVLRDYVSLPDDSPLRPFLRDHYASNRSGLSVQGGECGYLPPIGVRIKQEQLGEIVRELAGAYYGAH